VDTDGTVNVRTTECATRCEHSVGLIHKPGLQELHKRSSRQIEEAQEREQTKQDAVLERRQAEMRARMKAIEMKSPTNLDEETHSPGIAGSTEIEGTIG